MIEQKNTLSKIIDKNQENATDEVRDYIGASIIGSDCLRKIWYELKGFKGEGISPKTRRIWAVGKHLEGLIIDWLENAGMSVSESQMDLISEFMPYFKGHYDGLICVNKTTSILEIKTAKDASFNIFVKKGLKVWNNQYYAQIQSYMGMSGILSAYILVMNKDNAELSDELVLFDLEFYEKLRQKAAMIYGTHIAPPKINGSPLFYQCKLCKFNKVCHA